MSSDSCRVRPPENRGVILDLTIMAGSGLFGRARAIIDIVASDPNNRSMARPEAARRVKSYSSATGYVYQYYFYEVEKVRRGNTAGNQYVYMVSRDRKKVFPVRILVQSEAIEEWRKKTGRPLSGTEEYAAAKMCLFQALDEIDDVEAHADLVVNGANLDELLAKLDL